MHKWKFLFYCLVQKQPSITIHYPLKNCCFKHIIAFMSYKWVGYGVDILNFIMLWFPVDDARDPAIKWVWCNVGVLDYDEETKWSLPLDSRDTVCYCKCIVLLLYCIAIVLYCITTLLQMYSASNCILNAPAFIHYHRYCISNQVRELVRFLGSCVTIFGTINEKPLFLN